MELLHQAVAERPDAEPVLLDAAGLLPALTDVWWYWRRDAAVVRALLELQRTLAPRQTGREPVRHLLKLAVDYLQQKEVRQTFFLPGFTLVDLNILTLLASGFLSPTPMSW